MANFIRSDPKGVDYFISTKKQLFKVKQKTKPRTYDKGIKAPKVALPGTFLHTFSTHSLQTYFSYHQVKVSRNREFYGPRDHPGDFRRYRDQGFSDFPEGPDVRYPVFRDRSPLRRDNRYRFDDGGYHDEYYNQDFEARAREYYGPDFYQEEERFMEEQERRDGDQQWQYGREEQFRYDEHMVEDEDGVESDQREVNRSWRPSGREGVSGGSQPPHSPQQQLSPQPRSAQHALSPRPTPQRQPSQQQQSLPASPSRQAPLLISAEICEELATWLTEVCQGKSQRLSLSVSYYNLRPNHSRLGHPC